MNITYRRATSDDLDAAVRTVQLAYNDLRVRHGLPPTVPLPPPLFQAFCLTEDPSGLFGRRGGRYYCGLRL